MIIETAKVRAEIQNDFAFVRNLDETTRNHGGVITFMIKSQRARNKLINAWGQSEKTFAALWDASINAGCNPDFRAY